MTTKEHLKQEYQHYLCEFGSNHIETKVAKRLYDNYCMTEQEVIEKACNVIGSFVKEWNWQFRFNEFYINHDKIIALFKQKMTE